MKLCAYPNVTLLPGSHDLAHHLAELLHARVDVVATSHACRAHLTSIVWQPPCPLPECLKVGRVVRVLDDDGEMSVYAELDEVVHDNKVGDEVEIRDDPLPLDDLLPQDELEHRGMLEVDVIDADVGIVKEIRSPQGPVPVL